ncbi:MAG: hypothetical protein Q9168_007614 [Polycauliona sp. 1 TL-2023]
MSKAAAIDPIQGFKSTADLLTSKMVIVFAGHTREPYHVHHAILCERSAHCRAALEGPFTEAQSGQIAFPDEEPYTIKLFLHWVYHLFLPPCDYRKGFQPYVRLMSFARSILLEDLQNAGMDAIRVAFCKHSQDPNAPTVDGKDMWLAYGTTPELRKLRFFMCFHTALQLTSKEQSDNGGEWMDVVLTRLLERGGDLAVDLPRLLVYCSGLKAAPASTSSGSKLESKLVSRSGLAYGPPGRTTVQPRHQSLSHGHSVRRRIHGNMFVLDSDDDDEDDSSLSSATTTNGAWRYPATPRLQAESSTGLRSSMLLPAYNCFFHEHYAAANCSDANMDESVRRTIQKAWECFDRKSALLNNKGDDGGDNGKA